MKQELIKFNTINHDNELIFAKKDLTAYNVLLKGIQPLAAIVGMQVNKETFKALLSNPKEYAFAAIVGQNPLTVGGVPVSKNKAMDLIEYPDAWLKIIALVDAFNQELIKTPVHTKPHERVQAPARIGLDSFDLVNNEFVLSADFVSQVKSKHSKFTENENHNTALQLIKTLNDCLKGLSNLGCNVSPWIKLEELGMRLIKHGGSDFDFDASVLIDGIKQRERFAALSDTDMATYNKYGNV